MFITQLQIHQELPLEQTELKKIELFRHTITQILLGKDPRRLLIIGPCSIHHTESAMRYAKKLHALSVAVEESFFIVMRTYFEKSRTALGWKGLISDSTIENNGDMLKGIRLARQFLLELTRLGLPAGLEFLDPLVAGYIDDLVSWGSIGARTVQSQIHRQLASSLAMPVGFKNTTEGNVQHAVQAAVVAGHPHSFLHVDNQGRLIKKKSLGNIFPHIVLRGGEKKPNFDLASVLEAMTLLKLQNLPPALLIDCSHDNAGKDLVRQKKVFCHIIDELLPQLPEIRGLMLESFLTEGNTDIRTTRCPLTSVTDPCLSWDTTEAIVKYAHLSQKATRNHSCML